SGGTVSARGDDVRRECGIWRDAPPRPSGHVRVMAIGWSAAGLWAGPPLAGVSPFSRLRPAAPAPCAVRRRPPPTALRQPRSQPADRAAAGFAAAVHD